MQGRSGDRASIADNRYPVPAGFRQLLEALAREVLRGQPDDIYAFSALFFRILLELRSELGGANPLQKPEMYDKFKRRLFAAAAQELLVSPSSLSTFTAASAAGAKTSQLVKETSDGGESHQASVRSQLENAATVRQSMPKQSSRRGDGTDIDKAATKIQANVRGYLTRKRYKAGTLKPAARRQPPKRPTSLEDVAASKIQAGVRGYLTRKQLSSHGIPVRSPTSRSPHSTISEETASPRTPVSDPDVAASKIQAGVRGYLTRKQLAARGVPVHSPTHHSHSRSHQKLDTAGPSAELAATKIQAGVRGYLTRKQLENEGIRKSPARNANRTEMRRVTIADVDEAATKIQAGIRGFLTRKHLEAQGVKVRSGGTSPTSSTSPTGPGGFMAPQQQHNHLGDDGIESPGDAEEAAATKIQAVFRGHVARQQFSQLKQDEDFGNHEGEFM